MRLCNSVISSISFIIVLTLFRCYLYIIDDCFSDFCRHSQYLEFEENSIRVEVFPFILRQYSSILFYFIDLPFLFILIFSRNTMKLNKIFLTIMGLQPSYDILFLIGMAYFLWVFRTGIFGLMLAFWTKLEFTALVLTSWIFFWRQIRRVHATGLLYVITVFTMVALLSSMIMDTALINGPPNGKFKGQENTILRFLGYILMPISSVISYQLELSWHSNLIRLQTIFIAYLFAVQLKSIKILSVYIFVCTVIAIIVDFYQLRYVILFMTVYFLYFNKPAFSNSKKHAVHLQKEKTV